jgi:hypothetical protein
MNPLLSNLSASNAGVSDTDLARKADICVKVLAEAHRLARSGKTGGLFNQLVARAGELLDDMDEILVALDPAGSGPGSVVAAALRRELAQVRAAVATHWGDTRSASTGKR